MPDDQDDTCGSARWQRATLAMVDVLAVDGLFNGTMSVHPSDLGDALYGRLKAIAEDAPERPLVEMLLSILRMHETPTKIPPFGPMVVTADGCARHRPTTSPAP
jgi:hypothetical protein